MSLTWTVIPGNSAAWSTQVDAFYALPALASQPLVPAYFVKTSFARMGGSLATLHAGSDPAPLAVGLLFPRAIVDRQPVYTLRLHALGPLPAAEELRASLEPLLTPARVVIHLPEAGRTFVATHTISGAFDIGAPSQGELPAIRHLRGVIWGLGEAEAYPDDLHSVEFAPATSLVARRNGQVVGFLLGFFRFGLPALERLGLPYRLDLLVESQTMGVAAAYRGAGIAAALKREQARQALARNLDVLHWTADPLQFPNAVLNFSKLRALAGEFYRAYYPFQNELNRISASRLGLVWLPRSARGQAALNAAPRTDHHDLSRFPGCAILNEGPRPRPCPYDAPHLALEVPADWTALQRDDPRLAAAWRATSDTLLETHLGFAPGRYLIGDTAIENGRRYLIAHRFDPALLL
ncbi:MAG: GNAT family N-acetyltransferase [Oscillochloridaceae bacterium]|nr:GNAT family N-acetyltransferase [Chloroflexaceae bacterium]MDW8389555.1 GNAT family N-acetyltransferase [Oscillochloridaceae bacterium]